MIQVSGDKFFEIIGPINVTCTAVNDRWPYKTVFRDKRDNVIVGVIDEREAHYVSEALYKASGQKGGSKNG